MFSFILPETNLSLGMGSLNSLGEKAKPYGTKALLVTGKSSMKRLGFLERAQSILEAEGISVTVVNGIEPNPTVDNINLAIEKGMDCDMVIALGGGSSIDAAKVMAVGIAERDPDAWAYVRCVKETKKALPIIAIPSTSGTGSHVTWYAVVTNPKTGEKAAYKSKHIFPKESIVDVEIVSKMPKRVTAETGFDALAHVMEAYLSSGRSPITDALSLRAMELIRDYLIRAYENGGDMEARYNMAVADTLAGICITPSRTIMVHGIGNTVSGVYPEISHGQALACLSPPTMRFNIERGDAETIERYCGIARALGEKVICVDREAALKSVDAVLKLSKHLELDKGLGDFGVGDEGIEKMTDYSLKLGMGAIACNPVRPSREDILRVYREAL
jgi:alcohol dehydrogenase class IV